MFGSKCLTFLTYSQEHIIFTTSHLESMQSLSYNFLHDDNSFCIHLKLVLQCTVIIITIIIIIIIKYIYIAQNCIMQLMR